MKFLVLAQALAATVTLVSQPITVSALKVGFCSGDNQESDADRRAREEEERRREEEERRREERERMEEGWRQAQEQINRCLNQKW